MIGGVGSRNNSSLRGRVFWGNVAFTYVRYGETTRLLIRITDITKKKQQEQELIRAKNIAESATIAKAYFLNNMSHEIRTPINGVIGLAEIIQQEYEEEELKMYADLMLESGQRLLRTISSILDLTKLESPEYEIKFREVCLNKMLEEVAANFKEEAQEKGIELHIRPTIWDFMQIQKSVYLVKSGNTSSEMPSNLQKLATSICGSSESGKRRWPCISRTPVLE